MSRQPGGIPPTPVYLLKMARAKLRAKRRRLFKASRLLRRT